MCSYIMQNKITYSYNAQDCIATHINAKTFTVSYDWCLYYYSLLKSLHACCSLKELENLFSCCWRRLHYLYRSTSCPTEGVQLHVVYVIIYHWWSSVFNQSIAIVVSELRKGLSSLTFAGASIFERRNSHLNRIICMSYIHHSNKSIIIFYVRSYLVVHDYNSWYNVM